MRHKGFGVALVLLALVAVFAFGTVDAAEGRKGGVINVATIGEPPTLDPMISTADVVGMITQHYYETLFTFGKGFSIKPLLAAEMPAVSADGKVYTIKLREGVKFHNGKEMTSEDVLASLNRYFTTASRGKGVAAMLEKASAPGRYVIEIRLKEPYTPLLAMLSMNNSAAIVVPSELAGGDLRENIGTGVFKFAEHQPDRYIRLVRNDAYVARDDEPDLYGGRRTAYADEIRFIPVPSANTRIEGALAGQYEFADQIPVESYDRLLGNARIEPVMVAPYGTPFIFLNLAEGLFTNPTLRKAFQVVLSEEDMLAAAFGEPEFYQVDGSLFPEGYFYHRTDGIAGNYNQGDVDRAKALLKEAGYDGTPVRVLVSMQYEFHFKMMQVAAENMREAGFNVDMQVVDWATLTQRRNDPKLWDLYITHSPFVADPILNNFLTNNAPGWWLTPEKIDAVQRFNTEPNLVRRAEIYGEVQALVFEQVPVIKVGNFNLLAAKMKNLANYTSSSWPSFWNVWVE